ncbi:hypothetical protein DFH09DRAFT_1165796 [Mycena vulgaris]|nr:hypothetical protein DFH09DRAFT_1165796 [Mycena vulgaris]
MRQTERANRSLPPHAQLQPSQQRRRRRLCRLCKDRERPRRGPPLGAHLPDPQRGRHPKAPHERIHDLCPPPPPPGLRREPVHAHRRHLQDP